MANATIQDRLLRGEHLSVKMFGAVQDGSTDDREAIQAAIDFAASRDVPLLVPGGNPFLIGGELTIPSGLKLYGRAGATLKQKDASATDSVPFITAAAVADVDLEGLTIDGNRDNQDEGVAAVHALFFNDANRVRLRRMTIKDTSGNGVGGLLWNNFQISDVVASAWGKGNDYAAIYLQNGTYGELPTGASRNILIQGCRLDGAGSGSNIKLTSYADARLSGVRILGNSSYIGYPGETPSYGTPEGLGIEVWSGPAGVGGNSLSDIVIQGNCVDSETDGILTAGRTWGISVSQGTDIVVTGNQVKNCGAYSIELLGSRIVCVGNECYNSGELAVILSSIMGDQQRVIVNNNMLATRVGPQYVSLAPLAGIHVYIEGTGSLDRLQLCENDIVVQGAQRAIWIQANGSGHIKHANVSRNIIQGDATAASIGIALSPDGLGSDLESFVVESNQIRDIETGINLAGTNTRVLWNIFAGDIAYNYAGSLDDTGMIVDVSNTEGANFAPPAVQMRGRPAKVIDPLGNVFMDEDIDEARFASADDGVDSNPNVVNWGRANFGTELQGGFFSVNSRFNGFPNWVKTSTSAYDRAMFVGMGAARFSVLFGDANNSGGADPGELAFHVIDGNNTLGEEARVGTGAGYPFEVEQSARRLYARTGDPEGVLSAYPGSLYIRTDGPPGANFYVKETGAGNTGWVANAGTIWEPADPPTNSQYKTSKMIGLGITPASGIRFHNSGKSRFDDDVVMNGLTASKPLRLDSSKNIIADKIDLGAAADVKASGLSAGDILKWDGSKVVAGTGGGGINGAVTEITAGPFGDSFVKTVALSGTVPAGLTLTVTYDTAVTNFAVTSHTVTNGLVTE